MAYFGNVDCLHLRLGINAGVPLFNQPLHDGVLLFVDVNNLLKVPTSLLSIVDRFLQIVLGHRGHIINIVRPKVMLIHPCKPSNRLWYVEPVQRMSSKSVLV